MCVCSYICNSFQFSTGLLSFMLLDLMGWLLTRSPPLAPKNPQQTCSDSCSSACACCLPAACHRPPQPSVHTSPLHPLAVCWATASAQTV